MLIFTFFNFGMRNPTIAYMLFTCLIAVNLLVIVVIEQFDGIDVCDMEIILTTLYYRILWFHGFLPFAMVCSQIRRHVEQMGLRIASCGEDMILFRRCLAASFFLNAALRQPDGTYRYFS